MKTAMVQSPKTQTPDSKPIYRMLKVRFLSPRLCKSAKEIKAMIEAEFTLD